MMSVLGINWVDPMLSLMTTSLVAASILMLKSTYIPASSHETQVYIELANYS